MKMIKVKVELQKDDVPYWVPKSAFYEYFDQDDFINNQEVIHTEDAYSSEWFYENSSGDKLFNLPVIHLISDKTQFINGRHRTSVLLRHLSEIPISFTKPAQLFAIELQLRKLDISFNIVLPDLPTHDFGN